MENGVTEVKRLRDINIVTAEIKDICAQAQRMLLIYAVEIGRRLVEAKEILPHGAWGEWLKNEVQFSQSTANKHMKIFEAYGSKQISLFGAELNSETFTNLSYSQALKLLAVPEDEREDFAKDNDIENKSVREIDKLIKERDEALTKAQAAEQKYNDMTENADKYKEELETMTASKNAADRLYEENLCRVGELQKNINDLQAKLNKAKEAEKNAKAKMKEYKEAAENPEIPQEKLDKIKAEADEEAKKAAVDETKQLIEKELAAAKEKQSSLEAEIQGARKAAEEAEVRVKELQRQIEMADPLVIEFKTLFEQAQDNIIKLTDTMDAVTDTETKDKLRAALTALLEQSIEALETKGEDL